VKSTQASALPGEPLPALALREDDPEQSGGFEALQRPALERAIARVRLPYGLTCLILAVVAGPLGGAAVLATESAGWDGAVEKALAGFVPDTDWRIAVALVGWTLVFLSMLLGIGNITLRVERAQTDLGRLLPGGITEYRGTLDRLTNPVAPILVGLLVAAASYQYYLGAVRAAETDLGMILTFARLGLGVLIVGTSIWSTAVVWRALHEMGRRELRLRPFEESSSLGLRPIGELSLAAAAVYFVPLGILGLTVSLAPAIPSIAAILAGFVAVGVVLFVLPLRGAHAHMTADKGRRMGELRKVQLSTAFEVAGLNNRQGDHDETDVYDRDSASPSGFIELAAAMAMTNRLRALEISEQKLGAMHTWPVDTRILARLAAVAVPITLAILTDAAKRFLFSR
jgi:hypothetical protein